MDSALIEEFKLILKKKAGTFYYVDRKRIRLLKL